jgi:hypothetical protein
MNAHQRRVAARRRHMLLPLTKEVMLSGLPGRLVYSYRLGLEIIMTSQVLTDVVSATIHRHISSKNHVNGRLDLRLTDKDGKETVICTSTRGIRLKNPLDRAPRPWWAETMRKHRAAARSRS